MEPNIISSHWRGMKSNFCLSSCNGKTPQCYKNDGQDSNLLAKWKSYLFVYIIFFIVMTRFSHVLQKLLPTFH